MGTLLSNFRDVVSKHKDPRMKSDGDSDVLYSSGFPVFDFRNGTKVRVNDVNTGKSYSYYSLGITDGSACMLIGRSGCGKTTFAIQVAANILDNFPDSTIFHDDIEGGVTENRRMRLTGWSYDRMKSNYRYRNTGVTAENFYETLNVIKDIKLSNHKELTYDTGYKDPNGNSIYKLIPTIYILDSIAMLMPEKFTEEDELSGSMSAAAVAKTNSAIFKRVIPMLKSVNIILLSINHITETIDMNPYSGKKVSVSYLKQGEAIGGGKAVTYLTNLMLRFDDATKLKEDKELGVDGALVDVQIIKSRSGRSGSVATLVFDKDNGFDSDLSLYILLKNNKMITGGGAYMNIVGYPDMKFRQSEVKNKFATDPAFAKVFMETALTILKGFVNEDSSRATESNNSALISSSMMQSISGIIEEED